MTPNAHQSSRSDGRLGEAGRKIGGGTREISEVGGELMPKVKDDVPTGGVEVVTFCLLAGLKPRAGGNVRGNAGGEK